MAVLLTCMVIFKLHDQYYCQFSAVQDLESILRPSLSEAHACMSMVSLPGVRKQCVLNWNARFGRFQLPKNIYSTTHLETATAAFLKSYTSEALSPTFDSVVELSPIPSSPEFLIPRFPSQLKLSPLSSAPEILIPRYFPANPTPKPLKL